MDKELLALSDPRIQPGDDLIFTLIGERKIHWQNILRHILGTYKDVTWSWNWYNDGKQWLFKLVQKKKTIFWAAILATGQFRVTFYFGDKAEDTILASEIPESHKVEFMTGQRYGKIRPLSLLVDTLEDVETVKKVTAIKIRLK